MQQMMIPLRFPAYRYEAGSNKSLPAFLGMTTTPHRPIMILYLAVERLKNEKKSICIRRKGIVCVKKAAFSFRRNWFGSDMSEQGPWIRSVVFQPVGSTTEIDET